MKQFLMQNAALTLIETTLDAKCNNYLTQNVTQNLTTKCDNLFDRLFITGQSYE